MSEDVIAFAGIGNVYCIKDNKCWSYCGVCLVQPSPIVGRASSTEPNILERWFITFGQGHPLALYYVELHGTHDEVRRRVVDMFDHRWSMQYPEERWSEQLKLQESGVLPSLERLRLPRSLTFDSERQN